MFIVSQFYLRQNISLNLQLLSLRVENEGSVRWVTRLKHQALSAGVAVASLCIRFVGDDERLSADVRDVILRVYHSSKGKKTDN